MARNLARLTTIAAIVLLAGCGGGSGSKSAGSKSATTLSGSGPREVVSAKQGEFSTVVPLGFAHVDAGQYYAVGPAQLIGPGHEGQVINVAVVREPVGLGDTSALAGRLARSQRRDRRTHRLVGPVAVSVAGEPGLAVDYTASEPKGEVHDRQVFVRHGPYVYLIQEAAPADKYAAASHALEEVLSTWQWQ